MAQEVETGQVGSFRLDNQGFFGPWAASRPLTAGLAESLHHASGTEEEPKEKAPKDDEEDSHSLVIVSRYNIIPLEKSPSPLFSVFGRPLLFGGSYG